MSGGPAVGVVMPAYNSERFIGAALASLQAQTLTGWECVVVDDGSTDATAAAVEALAAADPRIRLIRQPHGGMSAARTTGLAALSDGVPAVALFDSDDVYFPEALQLLSDRLAQRSDAVGVFGLAEYMDENERPFAAGEHPRVQLDRRTVQGVRLAKLGPAADTTFDDLIVNNPLWPSAVALHRRAALDQVGGFDPSMIRQEDWELYLRMSRLGPFAVVHQQVVWYRRHENNSTNLHFENWWYIERMRRVAWESAANTARQRRAIAWAVRCLAVTDLAREGRRLSRDLAAGRWRAARTCLISAALTLATLRKPGPATPSRRRVHYNRRPTTPGRRGRAGQSIFPADGSMAPHHRPR